jgi:hypothetical protein
MENHRCLVHGSLEASELTYMLGSRPPPLPYPPTRLSLINGFTGMHHNSAPVTIISIATLHKKPLASPIFAFLFLHKFCTVFCNVLAFLFNSPCWMEWSCRPSHIPFTYFCALTLYITTPVIVAKRIFIA